jgi:hypothetical protein
MTRVYVFPAFVEVAETYPFITTGVYKPVGFTYSNYILHSSYEMAETVFKLD